MADDKLFEQLQAIIATGAGIDDQTFKLLTLATLSDIRAEQRAMRADMDNKAHHAHTHPDIESLKKRDWYSLTVAVVVALATSAMAWLKK